MDGEDTRIALPEGHDFYPAWHLRALFGYDNYGDLAFPLQVGILLSEPERASPAESSRRSRTSSSGLSSRRVTRTPWSLHATKIESNSFRL